MCTVSLHSPSTSDSNRVDLELLQALTRLLTFLLLLTPLA
jgi:hypothetical protein